MPGRFIYRPGVFFKRLHCPLKNIFHYLDDSEGLIIFLYRQGEDFLAGFESRWESVTGFEGKIGLCVIFSPICMV